MAKILAIASDHAGVSYKKDLIAYLTEKGYECINLGTDTEDSVDYPLYADAVCKKVTTGEADLGILICGTGIGISLAANRVPGIRAAVCSETYSAQLTREHNNSNIIAFGGRVVGEGMALLIVDAFLNAQFQGGRHAERVAMLDDIQP